MIPRSNPPVIIDTNVFDNKDIIRWLWEYRGDKIIPSVVYMELAVIHLARTGNLGKLDAMLRSAGIEIRNFDLHHAQNCAGFIKDDRLVKEKWKDAMIASYAATPPFILITNNVRDFVSLLGNRAMPPYEFKKAVEEGRLQEYLDAEESDNIE